jgi:PST family polysaccharide transporter
MTGLKYKYLTWKWLNETYLKMKIARQCDFDSTHDKDPIGLGSRSAAGQRLGDNIASLYLLLGLYYLIPLAVLPYLVRTLGLEMYGLVAFSQSFAQYFTTFTDYGFNFSATRAIAQQRDDHAFISRIFCAVYLIKAVLTVLGVLVLFLLFACIPRLRSEWAFFGMAYLGVAGNVLFPTWYFQGVERMRYISVIVGFARVLAAVMIFVLVHRPQDALLAVAIQSAGTVMGGLIGLAIAVRMFHLELHWPLIAELKTTLADGWHLFISSAAIGLYTNTNVFLVGAFAGNTQAAYFSAAEKLLRAMQALIGPPVQAIFPHVSKLRSDSDKNALAFLGRSLRWICGLTLIPSVVMFFFAGPVALRCFGEHAAGAISVLRWVAFLPVLSALSNVLGVNTMIPFGMDKQFSGIVIAAGLANIGIACALIPRWGADGAGASILIAEMVVVSGVVFALEQRGIMLHWQRGNATGV